MTSLSISAANWDDMCWGIPCYVPVWDVDFEDGYTINAMIVSESRPTQIHRATFRENANKDLYDGVWQIDPMQIMCIWLK